ncbi:MAG: Omp28-related outer membrane protein [Limnohabitans sp.]|nr:Omp28-related outer membrane protein [Limnohabitans sp.]
MKKITLFAVLFAAFQSNAQTIVSTAPQNKKVILEEFTGIHCGFCPQGHTVAKGIQDANPGKVFLINVHAGGYATPNAGEPDFRTSFGTAIDSQSSLTGYPAGTVNRTVFTGSSMTAGGTAMGRDKWSAAATTTLGQSSYVNVATTATLNASTRQLTVLVEAYYTGASPASTNKLNVALLQNNTKGPQSGGNAGNEYNHMHRLVHLLTGQWGEDITTTSAGTFVTRTYNYTIPASYNSVPAELGDMEIVAFVAEGQQKIISGNGTFPTITGLAANDVKLKSVQGMPAQCATSIAPQVEIQNYGATNLTSLAITYNMNGGTSQVYNWTGNLAPLAKQVVTLSNITYTPQATNTLNVSLPADANVADNTGSISFAKAPEVTNQNITIKITLDKYGAETSWKLYNSAGTVVSTSPTYTSAPSSAPATSTYPQMDINLTLPYDCYKFEIKDSYGDGMAPGSYQVLANGVLISGMTGGAFGPGETKNFKVFNPLSTSDFAVKIANIYPIPSQGIITLESESSFDVTVIDYTGKEIYRQSGLINNSQIDLSNAQKGVYFVKMKNEIGEQVEKIILE